MNIISLTTLPSRLSKLNQTLKSITKQCSKDDKVIVWLPKEFKRKNKENDWTKLKKINRVEYRTCEDVGPITKLYYTLLEYNNKDVNIICIDDDGIYDNKWLKTLLKYSNKFPNYSIGYIGRKFNENKIYNQSTKYSSHKIKTEFEVDLLLGVGGVLYKPQMFDDFFFKTFSPNEHMYFTDDIWIMGNLAKNNVKRLIIPSRNEAFKALDVSNNDALWNINKYKDNNDKSIKYFEKYW